MINVGQSEAGVSYLAALDKMELGALLQGVGGVSVNEAQPIT